jgi:putative cardiolipin synthase
MVLTLRATALSLILAVGAGCTYVPFDAPREVTMSTPPGGGFAAAIAQRVDALPSGDTALVPLVDGNDALGARLKIIERAERSIDLKTFLIKPDLAGSLMALELYAAAERGVRVRLLFDDVFTTAEDDQIAQLDSHPNIEIRSFNPLSRNSTTAANFALDFGRVNRRMHNKAMIVDGAIAVIGGRNIADEYYQINTSHEFADFDLLVAGAPVADLAAAFDLFWNDAFSVPLAALATSDGAQLRSALEGFRSQANSEAAGIYDRAVGSERLDELLSGSLPALPATAQVVVDDPGKLRNAPGAGPYLVGEEFYQTLNRAQGEVLVLTPYFVPEDYGAAFFEGLVARGVRVRIVTNSLAATNHPYVHGGYAPYRDQLLAAGVEFLEVRADAPALTGGHDEPLTMHTKLAVVDDTTVFVGSLNVDPRSIRQNSEIGVIFQSPALARNITGRVDAVAADYAFTVTQGADGRNRWRYDGASGVEVYDDEPGASFFAKLVATVTGWLPVESQL